MTRVVAVGVILGMLAANIIGFWGGIHSGLMQANTFGPKGACENFRLSVFDCDSFEEDEQ